jgi:hypothetical protein
MDYGRKMDLEELALAIDRASSVGEREHLERLAYRITHESAPIQSLRERLLLAFRARDMGTVKRIQAHIHAIKMEETYGKSWGSDKGNKVLTGDRKI